MTFKKSHYQFVISGAGMVGASLAAALHQLGYTCLLLDPQNAPFKMDAKTPDMRVSSISLSSIKWLQQQGVWQRLTPQRLKYYNVLSVRDVAGSDCQFDASSINELYLGCFVENQHLADAARRQPELEVSPARIQTSQFKDGQWQLTTELNSLSCDFLVIAEGANSNLRDKLGFAGIGNQYPQSCYCALVKLSAPVNDHTWQTFTNTGAHALLPLFDNYASLILYRSAEQVRQLKQSSEAEQSQYLNKLFTHHLPAFDFVQAASFPLHRYQVKTPWQNQALVIGDAAHSIHPLAGQGVNLGFRDTAEFIRLIKQHGLEGIKRTHLQLSYNVKRWFDVQSMASTMDLLYYSNQPELSFLKPARSILFNTTAQIKPLQQLILKLAIGKIPH
ncbi:FAD-dependent monooxygenase [Gayadomonas joobiniege]|uniref:FAD-dependent monooxygenase n=1 Tax=Gayadomonas joobiniege TaxID=1234606 RepID=UPI00038151B9|nr:FAD-dependent monooxygenase [Gayadomonas joobiniege]